MNAGMLRAFGTLSAARTTVRSLKAAEDGLRVEIDAIAYAFSIQSP